MKRRSRAPFSLGCRGNRAMGNGSSFRCSSKFSTNPAVVWPKFSAFGAESIRSIHWSHACGGMVAHLSPPILPHRIQAKPAACPSPNLCSKSRQELLQSLGDRLYRHRGKEQTEDSCCDVEP